MGEVTTVRKWLESYSGDQVRNLAQGTSLPGDRLGQVTLTHYSHTHTHTHTRGGVLRVFLDLQTLLAET